MDRIKRYPKDHPHALQRNLVDPVIPFQKEPNYLELSWKSTTYDGLRHIRRRQSYGGQGAARRRKRRKEAAPDSLPGPVSSALTTGHKALFQRTGAQKTRHTIKQYHTLLGLQVKI
jgi:hypothetical protein